MAQITLFQARTADLVMYLRLLYPLHRRFASAVIIGRRQITRRERYNTGVHNMAPCEMI
jgi:hypothetical protein